MLSLGFFCAVAGNPGLSLKFSLACLRDDGLLRRTMRAGSR